MSEHPFRDFSSNLGHSPFQHEDGSSREKQKVMVAVLGVVGVGKTSFINTVLGQERVQETSLEPSEPKIVPRVYDHNDRSIIFVDVPGFDNPKKPDILILRDFLEYVRNESTIGITLSGILYLHRITDSRMYGSSQKNLKLLQEICGKAFLPRLTLVTTMWDIVKPTVGNAREEELQETFWKDLIENEAMYKRYDGTTDGKYGTEKVIERYLHSSFPLTRVASIQKQAHLPLGQTDVGHLELESIHRMKQRRISNYEALQRQMVQRSKLGHTELKGDEADFEKHLEKELQDEQRKIDEANALLARYGIQNVKSDFKSKQEQAIERAALDKDIVAARKALAILPTGHIDCAAYLSSLGDKLESRFNCNNNTADLDEAIDVTRQAVSSTAYDSHRAAYLNNLGNKLENRYNRTSNMNDLDEAINETRQAVDLATNDHPYRTTYMNSLGNKLENLYKQASDISNLQEAIRLAREAVEATPSHDPYRAAYMNSLGNKLESLYEYSDNIADRQEALSTFEGAWDQEASSLPYRLRAVTRYFELYDGQSEFEATMNFGREIIDYIPKAHIRLLNHSDRQFAISTFASVAADLCALFLEHGKPVDALQYLENGRNVLVDQLAGDRGDLTYQHPEVAPQYEQFQGEGNQPYLRIERNVTEIPVITIPHKAVPGLDERIEGPFLHDQTTTEMQKWAAGGTIVVVNMTKHRSDAIIVSPEVIKGLPLPNLETEEAQKWLSLAWAGGDEVQNHDYLNYLEWLWEAGISQIVTEVSSIHRGLNSLPRIWWVGTGLASSLPFHAAGIHFENSDENTISRAISSYTPSIKALQNARRRAEPTDIAPGSFLMITVPNTPHSDLDSDAQEGFPISRVVEEYGQLKRVIRNHLQTDQLNQPSAEQVIESLGDCCIAHFACRGYTDHSDPSNSGIILQRYEEGQMKEERLTIQKLSKLSLTNARIAYLSNCSAVENKTAQLSDKMIHVASGFQVAGFPHVIGCFRPSADSTCIDISRFYSSVLDQGVNICDGEVVAVALHEAVMRVRQMNMRKPLEWAQFVHYGP